MGIGTLLGCLSGAVKLVIFISFLVSASLNVAIGYDLLERLLYILPSNRPEVADTFDLDLLMKVLMEPIQPSTQLFAVSAGGSSDGFEYGKSRAERRKKH